MTKGTLFFPVIKNINISRTYPATEPCATGLSTGAIVGIVIGCLAGVGLIAVAVYFLACKGSSDDEDEGTYQAGREAPAREAPAREVSNLFGTSYNITSNQFIMPDLTAGHRQ